MNELTLLEEVTVQEFRLELVDDSAARTRNLSGLLTAEEALIDIRRVLSVKDLAMWKQWDMDGYEPDVSVIGLSTRQSINLQKFSLIKDNVSKMNLYEIEDERGFELCLTEVESILAMTDEMSINELLTEEVL
tara:strand:- start:458 stop:856 length:399 start_codon:yes stop_codon:yes gene_type:complete